MTRSQVDAADEGSDARSTESRSAVDTDVQEPGFPVDQDAADELWDALQHRDERFDGRFVYAVSSTGIYCNPSCPSRKPRRDRVRFFRAPAEAESHQYRA